MPPYVCIKASININKGKLLKHDKDESYVLSIAHLLNELYLLTKFIVDTSCSFLPGKVPHVKMEQGNSSARRQGSARVMHFNSTFWLPTFVLPIPLITGNKLKCKNEKGNNSNIRLGKITVLMHCTSTTRAISEEIRQGNRQRDRESDKAATIRPPFSDHTPTLRCIIHSVLGTLLLTACIFYIT